MQHENILYNEIYFPFESVEEMVRRCRYGVACATSTTHAWTGIQVNFIIGLKLILLKKFLRNNLIQTLKIVLKSTHHIALQITL